MELKKLISNKGIFQELDYDEVYLGRVAQIISQTQDTLTFQTFLYAGNKSNITHKVSISATIKIPPDFSISTSPESQVFLLEDGIMYSKFLDMEPLTTVASIKDEKFMVY